MVLRLKLLPWTRPSSTEAKPVRSKVYAPIAITLAFCFLQTAPVATEAQDSFFGWGKRTFYSSEGAPLDAQEAEKLLQSAQVVGLQTVGGVPLAASTDRPPRGDSLVVLSDGKKTITAKFDYKTNASHIKITDTSNLHPGWVEPIKDDAALFLEQAYKKNIAAYQVDRLLGIGLITPCVERTIGDLTGSLCLWIEDSLSEYERQTSNQIRPPDQESWENQVHNLRLFIQLTNQVNYQADLKSLLIDRDWQISKVGASYMAFRPDKGLATSPELTRFSEPLLTALRGLSRQSAKEALKDWLTGPEISAMLARKDAIIRLADRMTQTRGKDQVLFR